MGIMGGTTTNPGGGIATNVKPFTGVASVFVTSTLKLAFCKGITLGFACGIMTTWAKELRMENRSNIVKIARDTCRATKKRVDFFIIFFVLVNNYFFFKINEHSRIENGELRMENCYDK
jgi:hypothetical protein